MNKTPPPAFLDAEETARRRFAVIESVRRVVSRFRTSALSEFGNFQEEAPDALLVLAFLTPDSEQVQITLPVAGKMDTYHAEAISFQQMIPWARGFEDRVPEQARPWVEENLDLSKFLSDADLDGLTLLGVFSVFGFCNLDGQIVGIDPSGSSTDVVDSEIVIDGTFGYGSRALCGGRWDAEESGFVMNMLASNVELRPVPFTLVKELDANGVPNDIYEALTRKD